MKVRMYLRRSKNDEGKQQFSLDVQRTGAYRFIEKLQLGEQEVVEYVDDGRAGDDFHTRSGLQGLIAEAAAGDVIVARDQSRLGRDAIEVTLVIRDLVRDRGLPALLLRLGARGSVRQCDRCGDDVHSRHRPPDGAGGDSITNS